MVTAKNLCFIMLVLAATAPVAGGLDVGAAGSAEPHIQTSNADDRLLEPVSEAKIEPNTTSPEEKIESGLLGTWTLTDLEDGEITSGQSETVDIIIHARDNTTAVSDTVHALGGNVSVVHENLVQASLSRSQLIPLANSSAVEQVRQPNRPVPVSVDRGDVVSQGVTNINTGPVYDAGYHGDNVTVAVIDVGFDPSNPEIRDNVVNVHDATGGTFQPTSNAHGTATAEVVVDTAPNASLVLVSIDSEVSLYQAIEYLHTETSTDVAVMSLAFFNVGPLDGSGDFNDRFKNSAKNGTAWSVAAGNSADGQHWAGTWTDENNNGWMEFENGEELLRLDARGSGPIWLQWDDWPDSDQNLELHAFDERNDFPDNPAAVSDDTQSTARFSPPTERLTRTGTDSGTSYLAVKHASGPTPNRLTFFTGPELTLIPNTTAGSIPNPTTESVLNVGATDYRTNEIEAFSSRGPRVDGRIKPDIVAPNRVDNSVYGSFTGTSAAAPHAAGAMALVLDANESLGTQRMLSGLKRTANVTATGQTEPNNATGHGLVDTHAALVDLSPETEGQTTVSFDNQTVENGSTTVTVNTSTVESSDFVVVVHTANNTSPSGPAQPNEIGAKVGESGILSNGTHTNISVNIGNMTGESDDIDRIQANQTLVAKLYEPMSSDEGLNHGQALRANGSLVYDEAMITVTDTPTDPTERALRIADVTDPADIAQDDVTIAITQFARDQKANGIEITQDDITVLITLFERH